ncbi:MULTISPECIES: ion transporter [unclassified Duganella]|jgi:voltage-gated potassium channel|uniref:ion transporter n=1 Tax=unclassified Duganella TaxID=2636909 RepID=UPI00088CB3C4|nr:MULTISPECIES: ion transporter [unclassified Duganella]SDF38171.1 voltage-gated potassium channel [Duganella sp. OV458]SDI88199.1 voltage-gated potassium channel [Duganella sp. OV510]
MNPVQRPIDPLQQRLGKPAGGWRAKLYAIIFESDTRKGRAFDLTLIGAILLSVLVIVLTSVQSIAAEYGAWLHAAEWLFTILFTLEYIGRCLCVQRPVMYARSFFGIIDVMSILPSYLSLFIPGAHVIMGVRILRLLRIFRILKLTLYIEEYSMLGDALLASRRKIFIFLSVVFLIVFLLGTVMYVVEGPENGYTSIPTAVYWAISTMTTVGFGDLVPKTDIGRAIASFMMLLGWGILAVPTGIISSEITYQRGRATLTPSACPACLSTGHDAASRYCKDCGAEL